MRRAQRNAQQQQAKPRLGFFREVELAKRQQIIRHKKVGCQTAVGAVERASKPRAGKGPGKRVVVETLALSVRATSARRLRSWCDPTRTVEELEEHDEEVVALDYAVDAAAARFGVPPQDAKELYADQAASNEATSQKRAEDAARKRRKGSKTYSTHTNILAAGGTSTKVVVYSMTAEDHLAKDLRRKELSQIPLELRPKAASQMHAPGQTPLPNQATGQANGVDYPKSRLPGTYENGVFQLRDRSYSVCKGGWMGPPTAVIYHATRAEADAQRAAWIEIGWLPEPSASNAVSKSTFEAPLAH